jgi:hypothetical protein
MGSHASARGVLLFEDRKSQRFVVQLLVSLGYDKRKLRTRVAPSGKGAGEQWVRMQYSAEVKALRAKNYQRDLFLLAMCDGDKVGVEARKAEFDAALREHGMSTRDPTERIATPVPTWSIETWLLWLCGVENVGENRSRKFDFPKLTGRLEHAAIAAAVEAWNKPGDAGDELPSIADGRLELARVS